MISLVIKKSRGYILDFSVRLCNNYICILDEVNMKNKTICFFGEKVVLDSELVENRLITIVEDKIIEGYQSFFVGRHSLFDSIVLKVLVRLKIEYPDIDIDVVISDLSTINENIAPNGEWVFSIGKTKDTTLNMKSYEEQIMKDTCDFIANSDLVICYVDLNSTFSKTKQVLDYANSVNKNIINLY